MPMLNLTADQAREIERELLSEEMGVAPSSIDFLVPPHPIGSPRYAVYAQRLRDAVRDPDAFSFLDSISTSTY